MVLGLTTFFKGLSCMRCIAGPLKTPWERAGVNLSCARVRKSLCPLRDCARRVYHVVKHKAHLVLYVADDVHDLHDVGFGTTLVDDCQRSVEFRRHGTAARHAAHIGRYNHQIVVSEAVFRENISQERACPAGCRLGISKKPWSCSAVQIHCEHSVGSRLFKKVGDQLGGYRVSRARFPVLSRIAEIRHNHRQLVCRTRV